MIHNALGDFKQETCSRSSFEDILEMIKRGFEDNESTLPYLKIADQLSEELSRIPKTSANYGLLHYDYELDNLILNKYDNLIYTIDFDDACYGWYDLDIIIAIKNIVEESDYVSYSHVEELFLNGYHTEREYIPLAESHRLTLTRFEALYRYSRIIRAVDEKWQNEPEWMTVIRSKLTYVSDT